MAITVFIITLIVLFIITFKPFDINKYKYKYNIKSINYSIIVFTILIALWLYLYLNTKDVGYILTCITDIFIVYELYRKRKLINKANKDLLNEKVKYYQEKRKMEDNK